MLMRMYTRWAEKQGYKVEIIELHDGEEAGIKSATLKVKGHNAYGLAEDRVACTGWCASRPMTPMPAVTPRLRLWTYPVIDDSIEIEVNESDCRIDTYRASGAGGQHVNTTDSAVRITHVPTGIVVQCQNERSQHKNRATAWNMLRARLYELELQKREEEANAQQAAKTDIGWGHQIRSYVLQPYQLVKDLRTGHESTNPQGVLDGDLNEFIEASLAQRVHGGGPEEVADID
jgi:peptide chain release factor 2